MIVEVARQLNEWILRENLDASEQGLPLMRPCCIKLLGQTALLESGVKLTLAATRDVDVYANYNHAIEAQFAQLLEQQGRELDPLGAEVWMPRDTRYQELYRGRFLQLLSADPEAILLSKALKAPDKNRVLIREYLAQGVSERFIRLSEKYGVNLELFV